MPQIDLLASALSAIENGVLDYTTGDAKRTSSALRNLYSGVLLLLKEKLRRESPAGSNDVLIYKTFKPIRGPQGVILVGAGKTTVDYQEIRERFTSLNLGLDWDRLERLRRIRNAVEHLVPEHPESVMREAIGNTFSLVASILGEHLQANPADSLDHNAWQTMLSEAQAYKEIDDQCRQSRMAFVDLPSEAEAAVEHYLSCPDCGSGLLRTPSASYWDSEYDCYGCGRKSLLANVLPDALSEAFAGEAYVAVKHGGESPITLCPSCCEEAFSISEDRCLLCAESRPHQQCLRCENALSVDESDEPLCSYCRHVMSRDD